MADLTPDGWLKRLTDRLNHERPELSSRDDYYRGDVVDPDIPPGARQEFSRFLRMSRANFVRLVVDAIVERLRVDGFASDNPNADDLAWEVWEANRLTARSPGLHVDSLVKRRGYAIVWPRPDGLPRISVEDPTQVIHEHDPEDPDLVVAAVKVWTDDIDDVQRANVYLPAGIHKFSRAPSDLDLSSGWEPLGQDDRFVAAPDRMGDKVPVWPFINRSDLTGYGQSEIDDVVPIQDRINKTLFDRVVAAEYGAFRQKWATGIEIPTDPETNQPIDTFEASIKRLALNENPQGRFGTFDSTQLGPYLATVEQDLVLMARIAGVPPHYLTSKGEFPSGDALRSAEAPLISKATRKQETLGVPWAEIMSAAVALLGTDVRMETLWRSPETRTFGEAGDWFAKLAEQGVSWDLLLPRMGFSRDEIRRARTDGAVAELLAGIGPADEAA